MSKYLNDPLVKRLIFLPGLVIIISSVVFGFSGYFQIERLEGAEVEQDVATQKANRLLQKVSFLRNQESLFLEYGEQYESLMQKGLVQVFDRITWVDGLLGIKQKLQLVPMVIGIEPEALLASEDLSRLMIKDGIFYFTRINLSFGLQTDIDLFRMLNLIAKDISPYFYVEKCDLELPKDKLTNPAFNDLAGNMSAECSLLVFQAKPHPLEVE